MSSLHSQLQESEIHQIHDKEYADLDTAEAATVTSVDIGKVVKIVDQSDEGNYYMILDTTPTYGLIKVGVLKTIQTTDATETTIYSFTTDTDYNYTIKADTCAVVDTGGNSSFYGRIATFKNDSGTLSQVGTTTAVYTNEDAGSAAWDCDIDASGTDIRVRVSGQASTTIDWETVVEVLAFKNS